MREMDAMGPAECCKGGGILWFNWSGTAIAAVRLVLLPPPPPLLLPLLLLPHCWRREQLLGGGGVCVNLELKDCSKTQPQRHTRWTTQRREDDGELVALLWCRIPVQIKLTEVDAHRILYFSVESRHPSQ